MVTKNLNRVGPLVESSAFSQRGNVLLNTLQCARLTAFLPGDATVPSTPTLPPLGPLDPLLEPWKLWKTRQGLVMKREAILKDLQLCPWKAEVNVWGRILTVSVEQTPHHIRSFCFFTTRPRFPATWGLDVAM